VNKRLFATYLIAASLGAPAPVLHAQSSLPQLGDGAQMSLSAERNLGRRIAQGIYRDPDYLDDPVLADYVQGIWQPLLAAARERGELTPDLDERFAWEIVLARDRTVNAFALPGGYLGVHLGLIALVTSRDELASVLGHELSHVTQRHIARMMTKQANQAPWVLGAMILGALAARKSADAANAAMIGSQAVAAQNQLNFSRDMEREADRIGFGVMTQAGFDGRGFASMFDKLQQANRINDNGSFPYLRSHPLTSERIGDMQARLQLDRPSAPTRLTPEHAMMAARARILSEPGVDALSAIVAQAIKPLTREALAPKPGVDPETARAERIGLLYAGTLAALKLRQREAASALITRLTASTAQDTAAARVVNLLAVEAALQAGDAARALSLVDASVQRRPEILLAARAQTALAAQGQAERASDRLQNWTAGHPSDATAWEALAASYAARGQGVAAIRAEAEARIAQIDYSAALDRLKAAQSLIKRNQAAGVRTDNIEASIIDTRTRAVELLLREQALER
jgi:predicted Zn-dependent protease